ncbi:hypothetical protein [Algoriphagus yeomjeoni]|uniref:Uncharacterized protein n=1 Tax=Algoriphagus yeomjeoni TaxID=291403 RepID=A0A327PSC8_9BACT|nr:hypothetical protein [Algoriphagus yeomjeoni]RAI95220.1 hypothetical protein LV83_00471 [Algoriphagus yeomjeoni]
MKTLTLKLLALVTSAMLLGACSQMATYENEDLLLEQEVAAKNGFKLTPYASNNGINSRVFCGIETIIPVRKLNGQLDLVGSVKVSNDQLNVYLDFSPEGVIPSYYSYFAGDQTTVANNGAKNTIIAGNATNSSTIVIPISGLTDVYPALEGVNIDLAAMFAVGDDNYWADGLKFANVNANQAKYFVYTIQTDCPDTQICYGDEEGSWTEGFEYNPGKNFSEYSSFSSLITGVKLQAGANQTHVGNAKIVDEYVEDGLTYVAITIDLLSGYVFGDESYDEEGNLDPGSIFVQNFFQSDVDNGTIPGLQNNNNPAPGQFDYKFTDVSGSSYTVSGILKGDYFGIKTSVQAIIDCPE